MRDKQGVENVVANHLSLLERGNNNEEPIEIDEYFPNEQMLIVDASLPWYANIFNYLACNVLPPELNSRHKKKLLHDVKCYNGMTLCCFLDVPIKLYEDAFRRLSMMASLHIVISHCIEVIWDP